MSPSGPKLQKFYPRPCRSRRLLPSVHRSDVYSQKLFWIAGTPCRLAADATLASRIGRPSPPGGLPRGGGEARSFRSRRDPDARYRSRSRSFWEAGDARRAESQLSLSVVAKEEEEKKTGSVPQRFGRTRKRYRRDRPGDGLDTSPFWLETKNATRTRFLGFSVTKCKPYPTSSVDSVSWSP